MKPRNLRAAAASVCVLLCACQGGRSETPLPAGPEISGVDVGSLPETDNFESRAETLLGSVHGRGTRQLFCEGRDGRSPKPDSAVLPVDARELVQPGFNDGKAVHFNAWWENCKVNLPASDQAPRTCGEFRALRDDGQYLLNAGMAIDIINGAGGDPRATALTGAAQMTAEEFDDTWKKWGLTERPDNFEQMYTLRYGQNMPNFRNPYPIRLPDGTMEDPNAPGLNGGSGQLPLGMSQLKDEDGRWTGTILNQATNCAGCHGGQIGLPGEHPVAGAYWGIPNNNIDPLASNLDREESDPTTLLLETALGFGAFSGPRGLNDASTGFELLAYVLYDWDSTDVVPDPAKHPFQHARSWQDSPSWFHQGHQPRKFKSGEVSVNGHRMTAAACAGPDILSDGASAAEYRDYCGQRLNAFHESLESPHWPEELSPIDRNLAAAGAILFHTKDLWAEPANDAIPRPQGNGSCAGCHGAYAPLYVNDPNYLATPELEGIASYIVPMEIIGAEPDRHEMTTTDFAETWNQSWWSYPEGQDGYIDPAQKTPAEEAADDTRAWAVAGLEPAGACEWANMGVKGYLAPSLYGIWATGPYLHNGSVPTIEQVLDSSQRATIWRRKLQTIGPVTGFDQSFATGYDFERVGWKHDSYSCEDFGDDPNLGCDPMDPEEGPPLGTFAMDLLQGNVVWAGALHPQYWNNPELRFYYDTRHTGSGKQGHEFTDVLSAVERQAIIEYLKTL